MQNGYSSDKGIEFCNMTLQECDLCEKMIHPAVRIVNRDIGLCPACFHHNEMMPKIVAKSIERFLIGNSV